MDELAKIEAEEARLQLEEDEDELERRKIYSERRRVELKTQRIELAVRLTADSIKNNARLASEALQKISAAISNRSLQLASGINLETLKLPSIMAEPLITNNELGEKSKKLTRHIHMFGRRTQRKGA